LKGVRPKGSSGPANVTFRQYRAEETAATIELTTGDIRSHEPIERRSGYVFAYSGDEGRQWGEIERVYPVTASSR